VTSKYERSNERCVFIWNSFLKQKCELCFSWKHKKSSKSQTIPGCDVSKEDNVNLFFSSGILEVFWTAAREVRSRTLGYDIQFPQEFAVFSPQSSSTYDNKHDWNEPSTDEMSRVETPNIPLKFERAFCENIRR
jgi:hypothetical protein